MSKELRDTLSINGIRASIIEGYLRGMGPVEGAVVMENMLVLAIMFMAERSIAEPRRRHFAQEFIDTITQRAYSRVVENLG